jgi:uncharacterized membrane protein
MDPYLLIKLLHILSATLLFGTGLGTAFYMWRADRSGEVAVIAGVARNVVLADWWFTTPAVILQPLTGIWMMLARGEDVTVFWLHWSIALYILAGLCWLPVVWLQIKMRHLANSALATGQPLPGLYHRYMRAWLLLGWPAFIAVLVIFYLMVMRPV